MEKGTEMMTNEEERVREILQTYISATYQADIDRLRSVFHPEARMTGYLGDMLLIGTPEPFFEDMGSQPSMETTGAPYQAEICFVQITGNVASAIIRETGFRGVATLEDQFHLIRIDNDWSIISKNFTSI
jgi:hypothetical protein